MRMAAECAERQCPEFRYAPDYRREPGDATQLADCSGFALLILSGRAEPVDGARERDTDDEQGYQIGKQRGRAAVEDQRKRGGAGAQQQIPPWQLPGKML